MFRQNWLRSAFGEVSDREKACHTRKTTCATGVIDCVDTTVPNLPTDRVAIGRNQNPGSGQEYTRAQVQHPEPVFENWPR